MKPLFPGAPPLPNDLEDLEKIAGLPMPGQGKSAMVDDVARNLSRKSAPPASSTPGSEQGGKAWDIHKRFAELNDRHGKAFFRFVGDLLDILLGGPLQARLVQEFMDEKASPRPAKEAPPTTEGTKGKVPIRDMAKEELRLGGEPRLQTRHYLKRKRFLANLFFDRNEFPAFARLIKQISTVCQGQLDPAFVLPPTREDRQKTLREIVQRLTLEINQPDLAVAWAILEADLFADLETIYLDTRSLSLVRPTYHDDLDKAYREAKKLLKLLLAEFEADSPAPTAEHRATVRDYLQDILEVYTHHHFILKHYHQTRPNISKKEFEAIRKDLTDRAENLRKEALELRTQVQRLTVDRDHAQAEARVRSQEAEELRTQVARLDPSEVKKRIQAIESKMNLIQREHQATIEEDTELRTALRQLDEDNQKLTQQLRDLHAIPDENAKSVEGLLRGKRVVIFGGVGRDHYLPMLEEAGVKDEDYEWCEGYQTISQARTSEMCGRCDIIVVITAYAGHLHLWQTRSCVRPDQTLFLVHKSGSGSVRQKILDKFKPSGNG